MSAVIHPFPTAQHEGWQARRSRSGFLPTLAGRHLARRLSVRCGGAPLSHLNLSPMTRSSSSARNEARRSWTWHPSGMDK